MLLGNYQAPNAAHVTATHLFATLATLRVLCYLILITLNTIQMLAPPVCGIHVAGHATRAVVLCAVHSSAP